MSPPVPSVNPWPGRFNFGLQVSVAAALGLMVVLVFGNVVLRYAFNSGITVSEELSRWLFVWMTFLGAVLALQDNQHLGTDMLIARLPAWGKRLCLGFSQVLMIGINGLLIQGSWLQARINWDVEAPVTGLPMAVVYAAGIAFGLPATVLLLHALWRTVSGQLTDAELVRVQASEDLAHVPAVAPLAPNRV